jgi:hypothetical protein
MSARMADRDAARTLVDRELNRDYAVPGDRVVVVDDEAIEKPYGWVFFYQSGRFLETCATVNLSTSSARFARKLWA